MKTCSRCGQDKPLDLFPRARHIKSGYTSHCKECDNKRKRESEARIREKDPEAWAVRRREYVQKYKERHPDRVAYKDWSYALKGRFGITAEQYIEMLEGQNGMCAGCGVKPTNKRLAVDHDRTCCPGNKSCGQCVRGLLCSNCNTALGLLKENVMTINNLLNYMKGEQ